jgi:hypothetical protein
MSSAHVMPAPGRGDHLALAVGEVDGDEHVPLAVMRSTAVRPSSMRRPCTGDLVILQLPDDPPPVPPRHERHARLPGCSAADGGVERGREG